MQLTILIIFILLTIIHSQKECQPLYPRIFWNPQAIQIVPNRLDHIFMFNTNYSCPYSFVHIYIQDQVQKFRCTEKKIQTYNDDQTPQFHTFVQTCSAIIQKQQDIVEFQYQIFGTKFVDSRSAISSDKFKVEMPTTDIPLRLAVISDWGPIIDRPYKPLNDTLDYLLAQRQIQKKSGQDKHQWRINGMLLNGDYAYELETTHCQRYVLFLNEITRITRFWPMLVTFGNHESLLPKSYYLFDQSFSVGNISVSGGSFQRSQTYRFVNRTTFLLFDPFLEIYKMGTDQQYQTMKASIYESVHEVRDLYPDEFFIMASHYPVMCSQVDPHCRDALANMPDFFQTLSSQQSGKGLVDMYIGSHMHQYERIWPFVDNEFVNESSPYYRGRMVNFVEAVAGVNYWEVENYYQPEYFSVYSTHNITGMGLLTFSGSSVQPSQPFSVNYRHIITPNTYEVVDQFQLTNQWKSHKTDTITPSLMTE